MKIKKITKRLRLEETEKTCREDIDGWKKRVGENTETSQYYSMESRVVSNKLTNWW